MQEEFIEIVDEIAGECVTNKKFYDEVRTVVNKTNAPAAAVPEPELATSDTESEQESATLHYQEDEETSDGDQKMAAKRTTPDKERKKAEADAAKVMASLRETHTLHDTNRQESPNEAVNKTHQSESGKKRTRDSIINWKRGKKKTGQHQDNEKICHAGLHCRMGDSNVVVEGNASNGCLCSKCKKNSFCLFVSVSRRPLLHGLLQGTSGVTV